MAVALNINDLCGTVKQEWEVRIKVDVEQHLFICVLKT